MDLLPSVFNSGIRSLPQHPQNRGGDAPVGCARGHAKKTEGNGMNVTKHTSKFDYVTPHWLRKYNTPEWLAIKYCDGCQADVSGPVYQQEDDANRYCEHCWHVVQDHNAEYAIAECES